MSGPQPQRRPWYREGYVWLVIGVPLSSVVVGAVMLVLSITSWDGLVVDDYYKRGLEINRDLGRDRAAARLGLHAELAAQSDRDVVDVTLTAEAGVRVPDRLRLRLAHPTRAGFDRDLVLRHLGAGRYAAPWPALEPGRWHVQIESPDWRLVGRLPVPGTGRTGLDPVGAT